MELRKALLSITAIVIVVLFMGMAMQPATTHSNERTFTVSVKQQVEYDRYFIQKPVNASDRFSSINNNNNKIHSIKIVNSKQLNSKISQYEGTLSFLFTTWLINNKFLNNHNFTKLNAEEKTILFHNFLNSNSLYKEEFVLLMNYESQMKGLQNNVLGPKTGNSAALNSYQEISKGNISIDSSNYMVSELSSTKKVNNKTSFIIYYTPLGKNNLIDPNIMVQINPITISFGWFGSLTVGDVYNLYATYHGLNALYEYQDLGNAINGVFTGLAAFDSLLAGVTAAIVGLLSAGIGLAVALAYVAAIAAVMYYCSSKMQSHLNNAFDSTYINNGKGCLELGYSEVKMLDGASESFSVSAWDKTSNSWLSIVPTLPQILSGFGSTVQSFSNKYGQNNWVYVSQSPYNY